MENLLLHICCAPCFTYTIEYLKEQYDYNVIGYYSNSNIAPLSEYNKRMQTLIDFNNQTSKIELFFDDYDHSEWLNFIKGFEKEKEGGLRCYYCIYYRLYRLCSLAKQMNIKYVSTTLSISPHKNTTMINKIGKELAEKNNIIFLEENYKKKNGFSKSIEISKKYNLYRQNYCGCEF